MVKDKSSYVEEFLCLRLTQNLQFYSETGRCFYDFEKFITNQSQIKMSIGHMLQYFQHSFDNQYRFESYIKLNDDEKRQNEITSEMSAKFKYLLFNYNENKFQIKKSQESRLFNFKCIKNLEEVIEDLSLG